MKKSIALLLLLVSVFSLSACEKDGNTVSSPEPTQTAVSSDAEIADAVNQEVFKTPVEKDQLIGNWKNDELSVTLEFLDDGTFINDSLEGSYSHDGNNLTLTYAGGQVTEDYSLGISNGKLVLVRDDFQIILDKAD